MKNNALIVSLLLVPLFTARAQDQTRGVGVYPGDPAEDYSPAFKIDSVNYRNLALHRPAFQSSSYDYNLTAQRITDGFLNMHGILPGPENAGWIVTTASTGGILPRNERESVLDRHPMTRNTLEGPNVWLQVEEAGGAFPARLDSLSVSGIIATDSLPAKHWFVSVSGSADGADWKVLGKKEGDSFPGDTLTGFLRRVWPRNLRS